MSLARHSALVKFFELSSRPAALVGPNALKPAALRSSTTPAAIAASGPTTTKSTLLRLQNSITAAWSAMSIGTHSASRAIPAFPGAHHSFVTSGDAAIFHASACSRPPEPSRRMCITIQRKKPTSECPKRPSPARGIAVFPALRELLVAGRGRDDFLQGRDMAGEGAAAGGRRG